MALSTRHEVEHHDINKKLIVHGELEHHHAGELCGVNEQPTLGKVTFSRTRGGGIAYEMEIYIDSPRDPSASDLDAIAKDLQAQLDTADPSE